MSKYSISQITDVMEKHQYRFYRGKWNVNLIGVRSKGCKVTNKFDDLFYLIYEDGKGNQMMKEYKITTDPGTKSMTDPVSRKGCAILVPGQYRSTWKLGYHKNQYEALVQILPVKVYRDDNRDMIYDLKSVDQGIFGINIHRAGVDSVQVDGWSAGCQVFKTKSQFEEMLKIIKKSAEVYGNKFTYTLLNEEDFE